MSKPLFAPDGKPDFSYKKCNTFDELADYIKDLAAYNHDYNTSGYAIVKALLAVEMYMAHVLGTTGFQHGFARLAFVKESMISDLGVAFINFDDLLYPQYDVMKKVEEYVKEMRESKQLHDKVVTLLGEHPDGKNVHPNVYQHWKILAEAYRPKEEKP